MKSKILNLLISGVLILFCMVSCSKKQPTTHDTLRIDLGGDIVSFDPQKMVDAYTFRVLSDLDEGLVSMDQANNPIAGMAESWQISPDGKQYIFHLRHDLRFSDGVAITASDFVYSWQRLANPKTGGFSFVLDHLKNATEIFSGKLSPDKLGVKALDNYTLQVDLASPDPAFLSKCTAVFTTVVPKHVIEAYGESWATATHIVSAGAYKVTDRVVNGAIKLRKNDFYYDAKNVKIAKLEFIPFQDRNAALAAYKAGNIDITDNLPIDQSAKLKQEYATEFNTVSMEGITFYSLNIRIKKLQNKDLRQALSMVIDRDILTNDILANGTKPLYGYVTATIDNRAYKDLVYKWSELPYSERVKIAKQLYAKTGYTSQKPLELNLLYDNNDASRKVALAISDMWHNTLGVKVTLQSNEWKSYLQSRSSGNFEVIRNSWGAAFNSVTTYTPEYECGTNVNVSKLCTNDYDSLINQANLTQDKSAQIELYNHALNLAMEQYAVIPLYQNSYTVLLKPYVKGLDLEHNLLHDIRSKWMYFQD